MLLFELLFHQCGFINILLLDFFGNGVVGREVSKVARRSLLGIEDFIRITSFARFGSIEDFSDRLFLANFSLLVEVLRVFLVGKFGCKAVHNLSHDGRRNWNG